MSAPMKFEFSNEIWPLSIAPSGVVYVNDVSPHEFPLGEVV